MEKKLVFRVHAIQRMFRRHITKEEVRNAIENGETVEEYPEDTPYPSRLILGWRGNKPLHVVAADNTIDSEEIVITTYEPTPDKWEAGFKRRKR